MVQAPIDPAIVGRRVSGHVAPPENLGWPHCIRRPGVAISQLCEVRHVMVGGRDALFRPLATFLCEFEPHRSIRKYNVVDRPAYLTA